MPRRRVSAASEDTMQANYRRENALRPNRFLGYNRNTLAMHLVERRAYAIAESELRRCVWLNPYEAAFMANLAWCICRQGRKDEAQECLQKAIERDPDNAQVRQIAGLMEIAIESPGTRGNNEARIHE